MVIFNKSLLLGDSVQLEVPVPDYVPFACHFDDHTILTKNGELLQIIKITGFSSEAVGKELLDLRETVRAAIKESITSDDFGLWFHTIRQKRSLLPGGEHVPGFSEYAHDAWNEKHGWDRSYVNELYITVIIDGVSAKIRNVKDAVRSIFYPQLKKYHLEQLDDAYARLQSVVDTLLEKLNSFGARRLGVAETEEDYISEPLVFFNNIMHLQDVPKPVPMMGISEYLSTHRLAFGHNAFEVIDLEGHKRFGAILTIKHYVEIPAAALDEFLQLPLQFIISQSALFIPERKAKKYMARQDYLLQTSGDNEFRNKSGIADFMDSGTDSPTDYADHQLSIMLLEDSLEDLNKSVEMMVLALEKIGILSMREDVFMEQSFWSQLPGNFMQLERQRPINTNRIAGYASLHNFPAGRREGNPWGPAVSIFHTLSKTPYFFNFHHGKSGHTILLGPDGSGKSVLMNFLLSEAQKFHGRLYYFDQSGVGQLFIESLGGSYGTINPEALDDRFHFNPLLLENTPENIQFLTEFFVLLIEGTEADIPTIEQALTQIFSMPEAERRLSNCAALFGPLEPKLAQWVSGGAYGQFFDNLVDHFDIEEVIQGFNTSHIIQNKSLLSPLLFYLLHQIERHLNGTPTIIVFDEAWTMINNPFFGERLIPLLDRLTAKNAIMICATSMVEDVTTSAITPEAAQKFVTKFFLPNSEAEKAKTSCETVWQLTEEEYITLPELDLKQHQFMVSQADVTVVASLSLETLKDVLAVLEGRDESIALMQQLKQDVGEKPHEWLPEFYKRCT